MNPYDHRPITFNGVQLAPVTMAVSIIERLIPMPEEVADWLWRLPICCGVEKSSASDLAIRAVRFAQDALLEQRDVILGGISERFPEYDSAEVYRQWMKDFDHIIQKASAVETSQWTAPGKPVTAQARQRFLGALDSFGEQVRKKAEHDGAVNDLPASPPDRR